jgi:small multidrug resistance pump
MTYLYLALAISAEVAATTFLKLSDGFSKPLPSAVTVIGYAVAFYFLSLVLRSLPTGLVYAVWSGVGVVLIATIAWVFQSQKLDTAALCGMGLIVSGVAVINLFSSASSH